MFIVQSYIKYPNKIITDLNDVIQNPYKYFVSIREEEILRSLENELDFFYIDGAVVIKYNGIEILGFRHWDLVDQLWTYLIDLLEQFKQKGEGKFWFPDQPIQVTLKRDNRKNVLLSIDDGNMNEYLLPEDKLIDSLLKEGFNFFRTMMNMFPGKCDFLFQIQKIANLRSMLNQAPPNHE